VATSVSNAFQKFVLIGGGGSFVDADSIIV
jgi:hypothetical protein